MLQQIFKTRSFLTKVFWIVKAGFHKKRTCENFLLKYILRFILNFKTETSILEKKFSISFGDSFIFVLNIEKGDKVKKNEDF
jgi:hypothetical protein